MVDGALTSIQNGQRATLRVGSIWLYPPQTAIVWEDENAHYRFMVFDMTPQACQSADGLRWFHTTDAPQPRGRTCGVELSGMPPKHLIAQARETLRSCCDRWWRGLAMRLQAQARLAVLSAIG